MRFDVLKRFKKSEKPSELEMDRASSLSHGMRKLDDDIESLELADLDPKMTREMAEVSSYHQIEVNVSRFDPDELSGKTKSIPTFVVAATLAGSDLRLIMAKSTPVSEFPEMEGIKKIDYILEVVSLDSKDQKPKYVRFQFVFPLRSREVTDEQLNKAVRKTWDNLVNTAINSEAKFGQYKWMAGVPSSKFV
jgi:hypothetical protein